MVFSGRLRDTGGMARRALSDLMADAARELEEQPSPGATMRAAAEVAVREVDGADAATLTIGRHRRRVETLGATSPAAQRADELQYELLEGPCLDAVWEERVVHSRDLTQETRWPRWAARASSETGFASLVAYQLFTTSDTVGALNLYSTSARGFGAADRDVGLALAAHVAIAVRASQQIEQLQSALDGRTVIAQAVGILMERYSLTAQSAFALLARVSSMSNTKLREISAELCAGGPLPGVALPPRSVGRRHEDGERDPAARARRS